MESNMKLKIIQSWQEGADSKCFQATIKQQLDRMVDRVKPWFMVHGSIYGSVHGSVQGLVHGLVHGSF